MTRIRGDSADGNKFDVELVAKKMSTIAYRVKCPKCSRRATARMQRIGINGTYREVTSKLGTSQIICESCGFCPSIDPEKSQSYELWYAISFKGHRLWATNRKHLDFLIYWISGDRSKKGLGVGDRAMVEAFPKWMILAKNKEGILKCLNRMTEWDAE